ncbi:SGNH/GDSL hydrolase family protein [Lapidilactobacillus achengensis]|uniref:SGNH/GDSL hydrolase family protein n=1 Tax=Lapidilactobacillus achengensis TaxID=2486000 RepID=A0ABW1UQ80_9LACO|nr:SGNH/GDSL hydrolase family protein [Lapidilactobacillus achengensis]
MLLEKNSTIVFAGDSVTDCGRTYEAEPAGWGSFGDGYVSLINAALVALYPEYRIKVINKGVNGDDILKLAARWQKDVVAFQPDYVSILIGVNDVWRHFDDAAFQHRADLVDEQLYQTTYQKLIDQTKAQAKQIFIMSPFMFDLNLQDPMRALVQRYAAIARELATKNDLIYIDIQAAVDHFLQSTSSYIVTADRVHPNLKGHMLVANKWLNAIDYDWRRC